MRRDDGYNAARAKQESPAMCLLDGIRRFLADLCLIPIYERILSHAAAHHTLEKGMCFC